MRTYQVWEWKPGEQFRYLLADNPGAIQMALPLVAVAKLLQQGVS